MVVGKNRLQEWKGTGYYVPAGAGSRDNRETYQGKSRNASDPGAPYSAPGTRDKIIWAPKSLGSPALQIFHLQDI